MAMADQVGRLASSQLRMRRQSASDQGQRGTACAFRELQVQASDEPSELEDGADRKQVDDVADDHSDV
eukprot:16288226-Heterocapsa_arctica.AAC.1